MRTPPPSLFIVIGANGAGKTTWARANRSLLPEAFYNADSIAEGLGDPSAPEPQRQAREFVDNKIAERLDARKSFGFESTWSGNSRPAIVTAAKTAGYFTGAVFIGTDDPEINIARVRKRVLQGGHDVPNRRSGADGMQQVQISRNTGPDSITSRSSTTPRTNLVSYTSRLLTDLSVRKTPPRGSTTSCAIGRSEYHPRHRG